MGAFKCIAWTKDKEKKNSIEQVCKRDREILAIFKEASKKGRPKK